MGIEMKKNIDSFNEVVQSFLTPKHSYIKILGQQPPSCQAVEEKRKGSSFKTLTAFVVKVLTDADASIEEKKSLTNSFEAILKPFVKKKKLIHYIFFIALIKKRRQAKTAKRLIEEFSNYSAQPEAAAFAFNLSANPRKSKEAKRLLHANHKTVEDLKRKKILLSSSQLHEHINKSPLGTFMVWKNPATEGYIFFQKMTSGEFSAADFGKTGPVGSLYIPSTKDLAKEISRLTEPAQVLERLKKEKKVFDHYEEAAEQLNISFSFAFFYEVENDVRQLYFIQKIPGVVLQKTTAVLIKSEHNLLQMIKEQTNEKKQLAILASHQKVCRENSAISKAEAELKNPGDFYLYMNESGPTICFVNLYGKKQHKSFQNPADLFFEINKIIQAAKQNKDVVKDLKQSGRFFKQIDLAIKYLEKVPAGTYACVTNKHSEFIQLIIKIPNANKVAPRIFTIACDEDLSKKFEELVSPAHQLEILKKEGAYVNNVEEAIRRLAYKNYGEYAIWQTPAKGYQMLVKQASAPFSQDQIINLDDSMSLLEQIEKHLPSPLHYPGYTLNEDAAKKKLDENFEFGNFVFFPKKNYLGEIKYKLLIRVSKNSYEKIDLTLNELKSYLDFLKTPEGLWECLFRLGYAYNTLEEAQIGQQEKAKDYILWKGSMGEVKFAPYFRGKDFAKITPLVIPGNVSYQNLKEGINQGINPKREQLLKWLEESGILAQNGVEARKKLFDLPLGSYVIWREGAVLNFLRKHENFSHNVSKPIGILESEDLAQKIASLVSHEAQLEWLKSHHRMRTDSTIKLAPGDYEFLEIDSNYYFRQQPFSPHFKFLPKLTLLKKGDFWSQIDRLTSATFQWKTLEKGGVVVADETQAIKECPVGDWRCWKMPNGEVKMLYRTAAASSCNYTILPDDNLFKKIAEKIEFATASTQGAFKPPAFHSSPGIKEQVQKLKNNFLNFVQPGITSEECAEKSFVGCVELYRKIILKTHPDKVLDADKETAEIKFKALEAEKEKFTKNLQQKLKNKIDLSGFSFSKLAFASIDAFFLVDH